MSLKDLAADVVNLRLYWHKHTPSWQRYGDGNARLEISGHIKAKWLTLLAAEYGEKSGRQVILTLDEKQLTALRDVIDKILPR